MTILAVLFHAGDFTELTESNYLMVIFLVFYWGLILFKYMSQENEKKYAKLVLRHLSNVDDSLPNVIIILLFFFMFCCKLTLFKNISQMNGSLCVKFVLLIPAYATVLAT